MSLYASYVAPPILFIAAFLCMRLSLILLLPRSISSLVVSSQQRKLLHSFSTRRKAQAHRTTMSSNPSALYTPQDIKGWTALVTGASSGFGKATAISSA